MTETTGHEIMKRRAQGTAMTDTIELPRELDDWKLMNAKRLPTFYSEVGRVTVGDSEWRMGRSEQVLAFYLFTDLPHPDDPKHKCIYMMDASQPFRRLCEALIPDDEAGRVSELVEI